MNTYFIFGGSYCRGTYFQREKLREVLDSHPIGLLLTEASGGTWIKRVDAFAADKGILRATVAVPGGSRADLVAAAVQAVAKGLDFYIFIRTAGLGTIKRDRELVKMLDEAGVPGCTYDI